MNGNPAQRMNTLETVSEIWSFETGETSDLTSIYRGSISVQENPACHLEQGEVSNVASDATERRQP